jgi:hypothetical protein
LASEFEGLSPSLTHVFSERSCFLPSGFSLSAFQLFASWPVEQRALGLLLAGIGFGQAPNEMASNRRSVLFHL